MPEPRVTSEYEEKIEHLEYDIDRLLTERAAKIKAMNAAIFGRVHEIAAMREKIAAVMAV